MERTPAKRTWFRLFVWYWLPVLLYLTVIFTLSAQPNLKPPLQYPNSDKSYHLLEYFGLGLLGVRALRATLRLSLPMTASFLALAFGILVAGSDEYFQSFTPGRDSSVFDAMADTAGVILAQLAWLTFSKDQ